MNWCACIRRDKGVVSILVGSSDKNGPSLLFAMYSELAILFGLGIVSIAK